jgi:hypothetical protein
MNNYATILRWLGNFLLIIGYVILLYNDIKVGLAVKFIGGLLCIPSFIKLKLWDALVIVGFFAIIEGTKLIHLYFQVSK